MKDVRRVARYATWLMLMVGCSSNEPNEPSPPVGGGGSGGSAAVAVAGAGVAGESTPGTSGSSAMAGAGSSAGSGATGASCPGGVRATIWAKLFPMPSLECQALVEKQCPGKFDSCVGNSCKDYLACACSCPDNDVDCYAACRPTIDCGLCLDDVTTCGIVEGTPCYPPI